MIKSAEKAGNKAPVEVQVKTYEDLKSKYNKLQEENVSLTDVKKLTSQDKAVKSTRNKAKEGVVNNMCFLYRISNLCILHRFISLNFSIRNRY